MRSLSVRLISGATEKESNVVLMWNIRDVISLTEISASQIQENKNEMNGAPPSVGGEGVARPPREKKKFKKSKNKKQNIFFQSYRKERYEIFKRL